MSYVLDIEPLQPILIAGCQYLRRSFDEHLVKTAPQVFHYFKYFQ
jgi:hypothetical protein